MAQIQKVDLTLLYRENLPRHLGQTKRLRHLTRTRLVIPRGRADYENTRRCAHVFVLLLCRMNAISRCEPLDRKVVVRIGKSLTCFASSRRLIRIAIVTPCDLGKLVDRRNMLLKRRIVKPVLESMQELLFT